MGDQLGSQSANPDDQHAVVLVDTSGHVIASQNPDAAAKVHSLAAAGRIGTCHIVKQEMTVGSRSYDHAQLVVAGLDQLHPLPITPDVEARAEQVMMVLCRAGQHRAGGKGLLGDLLVAATAEIHNAIVLHYDDDFDRVCAITHQPMEWIVPKGSGHPAG